MRFATLLLLATAVSAVRIQQTKPSKEEMMKKFDEAFAACDTNSDGVIMKDEAVACATAKQAPDEVIEAIEAEWPDDGADKKDVLAFIKKHKKAIKKELE